MEALPASLRGAKAPIADQTVLGAQPAIKEEPVPAAPEEKKMYPAVCATCGLAIEVPFEPDDSRPTFCKDCLRDYQRAVAKAKQEEDRKNASRDDDDLPRSGGRQGGSSRGNRPQSSDRHMEPRVYAATEAPMKLSQTQFIAPKKFKALGGNKKGIDRSAIRSLIDNARPKHSEEA
ncbi:MAG: hypothetical protein E6R05_03735 [Candidatus Moraniibacteriota bacterium]|nr:MAG: hypothetical protein E6R05_03735 [Candidatus Moranbacteria bacterium]